MKKLKYVATLVTLSVLINLESTNHVFLQITNSFKALKQLFIFAMLSTHILTPIFLLTKRKLVRKSCCYSFPPVACVSVSYYCNIPGPQM